MNDWIDARRDFKCAICGRPDWCSYSPTLKGWSCKRIDSPRRLKNGAHFHPDGGNKPAYVPKPKPKVPSIDAEALMTEFAASTPQSWIYDAADNLGVTPHSLMVLQMSWARPQSLCRHMEWLSDDGAWAFPMRNGLGKVVGIRLRTRSGNKISVTGGKEGLFIPQAGHSSTAYMVEGPTDLAAAITFGLWGIGRPTCRGGIAHTQVAINRLGIRRVIIIGDNDLPKYENQGSPGIEGAKTLAQELQVPVATMLLPTKDLRQFLIDGGTAELIHVMERQLVWRQPKEYA